MKFIHTNPKINLFTVLRQEVYDYFKKEKIPFHGTWKSQLLAGIIIFLFLLLVIIPYLIDSTTGHYVSAIFLGITTALIGFVIGHGASHGSFSKNTKTNELLSYSFDLFAAASSFFWKTKHEVAHHFFTNIMKFDDDIETGGVFRFSPLQKWHPWHIFQILYMLPFYAILHFQWIFVKDFQKLIQKKVGETKIKKIEFPDILIMFMGKLIHVLIFIVLPLKVFGFKEMIIAYAYMIGTTGLVITIIFQLAHVQRKSTFLKPDELTGNIETDWVIAQIISTANFGQESFMVRLLTGGLSNQIEHHIFPEISPEHYHLVSPFVKKFCREHNVPYNSYRTILAGFNDHVLQVLKMSIPPKQLTT